MVWKGVGVYLLAPLLALFLLCVLGLPSSPSPLLSFSHVSSLPTPKGKHGFDCFSHKKGVLIKSVWKDFGLLSDPSFIYPPWTDGKLNMLRTLAKLL